MGSLRLVPSGGVRAEKNSSSSGSKDSSTDSSSSSETSPETPEHYQQPVASLPQPFVATVEPIDIVVEERDRNIICHKVLMLAAQLFPDVGRSDDLQIEYVGSGSFHNVVGFTVPTLKLVIDGSGDTDNGCFEIDEEQYVVRIPRSDITDHSVDMRRNIATLRGIEDKLNISTPRVVAYDMDNENALDSRYTLETRLRGHSLEDMVGNDETNEAQNVHVFKQVVQLVETLSQATAPYAGSIADMFGEGIDEQLCTSGIPMKMFEFPFDARTLTALPDKEPLTFLLKLIDLWVQYEHEKCPDEDNFVSWNKIKGIMHGLQRRDLLGDTFYLSHGDLASRNILAEVVDESSLEITGVVDWDFACFAPKFCAYKAPMDMWSGSEEMAVGECTAELVKIFKNVASPEYVRYAFSVEARIGRKIWYTLRNGMVGEQLRWFATNNIWEWQRLHPEDQIENLQ